MVIAQLGESANELVQKWGKSGYRYGFPDQYAAEFPFQPMHYDQSRVYQGVIGRHYPDARTERYHYLFDQNMYMQPGVPTGAGLGSDVTVTRPIAWAAVGGAFLAGGVVGTLLGVFIGKRRR